MNIKNAESFLYDAVCKIENMSPEAVKLITSDFNGSKFKSYVPHYHQYINFATRKEKILDHSYWNISKQGKQTEDYVMCHFNSCL